MTERTRRRHVQNQLNHRDLCDGGQDGPGRNDLKPEDQGNGTDGVQLSQLRTSTKQCQYQLRWMNWSSQRNPRHLTSPTRGSRQEGQGGKWEPKPTVEYSGELIPNRPKPTVEYFRRADTKPTPRVTDMAITAGQQASIASQQASMEKARWKLERKNEKVWILEKTRRRSWAPNSTPPTLLSHQEPRRERC